MPTVSIHEHLVTNAIWKLYFAASWNTPSKPVFNDLGWACAPHARTATAEQDRFYDTRFDIGLPTRRLCRAARWLGEQDATAILPLGLSRASTGAAARGGWPDLAGLGTRHAVAALTPLIVGVNDHDVITLDRRAWAGLHCPKDLVIAPGAGHFTYNGIVAAELYLYRAGCPYRVTRSSLS